jgi:UDP-3-O-[3-hydroxymyristoyl] glucosamine N-acyltransferase
MPPTHTSGSLAGALGAQLRGRADLPITHVDALDRAGPGALTFIRSSAFAGAWAASAASAALVTRGIEVPGHDAPTRALLIVEDADLALVKVLELFAPPPEPAPPGVHASAVVDPSARVAPSARVGPCCVIGAGASIGEGAVLVGSVNIGARASIGAGTVLHPGVMIGDRCTLGRRCTVWGNVVIGADGFGFVPTPDGRAVVKVPHIGTVAIGDEVEIGANSCVDRAKFGATEIGAGTKIDNLVQIGHNCRVGRGCLLCGMSGLAGSVTLGDGVIVAAGTAISDNLTIGAGARIGGRSAVINDIPAGETWLGQPALPAPTAAKNYAAFRTLADQLRQLRRLHKALEQRGLLDPGLAAADD